MGLYEGIGDFTLGVVGELRVGNAIDNHWRLFRPYLKWIFSSVFYNKALDFEKFNELYDCLRKFFTKKSDDSDAILGQNKYE